ncbi:MAG: 3-hydroxyacyl-CoA dehydrogenase [Terracidiphilus sp.]
MDKIAVVGCGVVGSSWALVFARAGLHVTLYDPSRESVDAALEQVRTSAAMLEPLGLLHGRTAEQISALLTPAASLAEALRDAGYVQESAPERLEIKRELYRSMGSMAGENVVLASSTSGLPASAFSRDIEGRERVIVAHPVNPPHLIPLVEIVPAPWTSPDVFERTQALMKQVGQVPVTLSREIDGFIVNRLQSAVLSEAFRLVEDGICSASGVDAVIADGLGLRWFFLGPFETIDLNAQGGIADYCAKLGSMYYELAKSQADPRPWGKELVANVERQLRETTPAGRLESRRKWRDRCLAALVKARQDVLQQ